MIIIGCDFHPSRQQICWLDMETGEMGEAKLVHGSGEVEKFYKRISAPALIGMEATGNCQQFTEMVTRLGHELWIGDAAWKLAIRLYWMLRMQKRYPEIVSIESRSRVALVSASQTEELIGRSRPGADRGSHR